MPPLERRRRRHPTPAVLVGVAAVLVVAVLVGGLFEVGRGSTSYHRDVNRSYAAQASLLVATSNQQGDQVRALMDDMPGLDRDTLESRLGSLSAASAHLAASATALEPPAPTVGGLATALAERASALSQLRAAVDGLLTLDRAAPLAPPSAAARVTAAGALLARADAGYASVRRAFRAAPGNATLPRSVWVPDAQLWAAGPATTLVSELTSSPSLAPRPEVVLLPSTVAVMPTSVPRVTPGGASVVPPTTTLGVSVVVADRGNMPLDRALVSARVVPQGPGTVSASSVNVALEPSSTVAVTLPTLSVAPGDSYTLTVSVLPPAGQANLATTSFSYTLTVAPPTPPTTTTTTAPPPTTTTARSPATTAGAQASTAPGT